MGLWVLVHLQSSHESADGTARPLPASEGNSDQKRVQSKQEVAVEWDHSWARYTFPHLEEWANLARIIFKDRDEDDIIDQFTAVVRNHYVQVKKSQSDK